MNKIPHYSWSHSSLGLMSCPRKYELVRAKKIVTTQLESPSAAEGIRIHELIEAYFKEDKWDPELNKYKRILETYKAKGGVAEAGYAFKWVNKDEYSATDADQVCVYDEKRQAYLVPCEMDDPMCWYRGFLDWSKIDEDAEYAEIVDWKTGRVKPSKQNQLYAWIVFTAYPKIKKAKSTFHWINKGDQLPQWFDRKDMVAMFQPFQDILDQIDYCYQHDTWMAIPGEIQKSTGRGENCRFCPVDDRHCEYGIKYVNTEL